MYYEGTFSLLQIIRAMEITAGSNAHQYATWERRIAQASASRERWWRKWECVLDKLNLIWQELISRQKICCTALE